MKRLITIFQLDNNELRLSDDDQPIIIGSGPDAHIVLPGVESTIGFIADEQGHLFIQPASGVNRPLFHNHRIIAESTWLKSRDQIRIDNYLIYYELRGDRLTFSVTDDPEPHPAYIPQPPSQPPPPYSTTDKSDDPIPVQTVKKSASPGKQKIITWSLGLVSILLGLGVLFVLLARPLELSIEPEPDSVSLSGFPPVVSFGSTYLCLPGDYRIRIDKDGYRSVSADILIEKETDNRFSATLEKLPGILHLAVTPEGPLTIYSGDTRIGATPPDELEIPAGSHRLILKKPRYQPKEVAIEIDGLGKTQLLEVVLKPDWADISISSEPEGADVSIDGIPMGRTPFMVELLGGNHEILVTKELYVQAESTLAVMAEQPQHYNVQLKPLPGILTITSSPANAVIRMDKEYSGATPLSLDLAPDIEHRIEATLPGHVPQDASATLKPGERKTIKLTLKPQQGTIYLALSPPDATLSLDGTPISNTQLKLTLPARSHELEISADGYVSEKRTIAPKAGYTQRIDITLEQVSKEIASALGIPTKPFLTSQGQSLLPVQPTSFTMGAPRREPGRRGNEHEHRVAMSRPYYLSAKLVTNKEYRKFDNKHNSGDLGGISLNGDNQPVVDVTWDEAIAYLNWLSEEDNLRPFYRINGKNVTTVSPPTNGYRLPTEAEWAFTARILGSPVQQRFPWSGGFPPRMAVGNFADESARSFLPNIISGYNDAFPVSSPVGSFPANKGGFYDMGGNVAEWCHNFYAAYISPRATTTDPLGPETGTHRVVRGSSWRDSSITELRLSYRGYQRQARNNIGFRIARFP